jgi:hypothetical protein
MSFRNNITFSPAQYSPPGGGYDEGYVQPGGKMSNPYQNPGAYGSGGGPQQPGVEGVRISPNTGKPMRNVTINGENKSVTIGVDEQGGVFLDSKELAEIFKELAEIINVDVLLTDRIKEVVTQYPQSSGGSPAPGAGYQPLTQVEIEGVGTIAVGPYGETFIDAIELEKLLKLGEEGIVLVRNAAHQVWLSYERELSELESRLKGLAPMVEAMHATEGQLPPEKQAQLLMRIPKKQVKEFVDAAFVKESVEAAFVKESVEAAFDAYHGFGQASITMRCHDCSARFQPEDVKWVATHPSLKGDPLLGQEAFLRFISPPQGSEGVLDAKGSACTQTACPKCHQILQYESVATLTENPYAPA